MDHKENLGVKVTINFWNGKTETLRNVTETHYNYNYKYQDREGIRVAFESDIHHTGITYNTSDIKDFWTELETDIKDKF